MAKKMYAPVESGGQSLSENIVNMYVPLSDGQQYLSEMIVKGYCSVEGLSKAFYDLKKNIPIFENGVLYNVKEGASLSNTTPIIRYVENPSSIAEYYRQISEYYGTNKCILGAFNTSNDFQYVLDSNNDIVLNRSGEWGANYNIYIPLERVRNCKKVHLIAKGNNSRLYVNGAYFLPNDIYTHSYGTSGTLSLTNSYQEYSFNLISSSQYMDYIQFITEYGTPHINKIWIER